MTELENTTSGIDRRTVVKGAAWSVPVIAAAVASPLAAATTDHLLDISVNAECYGIDIGGFGASFPRWEVAVANGPIPAGTVFVLESSAIANISLGGLGNGITVGAIYDGNKRNITVNSPSSGFTASINGVLDVFLAARFTLSLLLLPDGYADTNAANNSDAARLSGISLAGLNLGRCTEL